MTHKRPVTEVLATALPYTLSLGAAALALAYGIGVSLALFLVALSRGPRALLDRVLLVLSVVPRFWLGVMLILLLHATLGWFPASHAFSPGGGGLVDHLRHLVLPSLTLGLPAACVVARYQFAAMERILEHPHIRTARAVGSGGLRLVKNHLLRPGLGGAVALFAVDFPVIVSGAIVVEVIFAWPGVARLTAEAVLGADYPLALASALLSAAAVILGRLAAAVVVGALDPRQAAARSGRRA